MLSYLGIETTHQPQADALGQKQEDGIMQALDVVRLWSPDAQERLARARHAATASEGIPVGIAVALPDMPLDLGQLDELERGGFVVYEVPPENSSMSEDELRSYFAGQLAALRGPAAAQAMLHGGESEPDTDALERSPGELTDPELDAYVGLINDPSVDGEVPL